MGIYQDFSVSFPLGSFETILQTWARLFSVIQASRYRPWEKFGPTVPIYYFLKFCLFCTYGYFTWMHVYASFMYLNPGMEETRRKEGMESYKQLCRYLGLNLDPLEEQPLQLMTEPSPHCSCLVLINYPEWEIVRPFRWWWMSQGKDDRFYHFVVRHPVIFSPALSSPSIWALGIYKCSHSSDHN